MGLNERLLLLVLEFSLGFVFVFVFNLMHTAASWNKDLGGNAAGLEFALEKPLQS